MIEYPASIHNMPGLDDEEVAPQEIKKDDDDEVDWMTDIYEKVLKPDLNDDILAQIK